MSEEECLFFLINIPPHSFDEMEVNIAFIPIFDKGQIKVKWYINKVLYFFTFHSFFYKLLKALGKKIIFYFMLFHSFRNSYICSFFFFLVLGVFFLQIIFLIIFFIFCYPLILNLPKPISFNKYYVDNLPKISKSQMHS